MNTNDELLPMPDKVAFRFSKLRTSEQKVKEKQLRTGVLESHSRLDTCEVGQGWEIGAGRALAILMRNT